MKQIGLLALASLLPFTAAHGDVYKWVDENGVVHYSDQKPMGQDATTMEVRTKPARSASQPSDRLQQQVDTLNRNQEVEAVRQQQQAEEEQARQARQERCERARKNLETMSQRSRLQVEEADGSVRYLSPEEIVEQKERAEKIIQEECGAGQ